MIYHACALLWLAQFAAFTIWTVSRIDRADPLTLLALYIGGGLLLTLFNGLIMAVLTIAAARACNARYSPHGQRSTGPECSATRQTLRPQFPRHRHRPRRRRYPPLAHLTTTYRHTSEITMPTEEDEDLTIAIYKVTEDAELGDPYMQALQCGLIRLYDAAGERRPVALGGPRRTGTRRSQDVPPARGFLECLK